MKEVEDPNEILERDRRASQFRLKSAWEAIFEKYDRDTSDFADEIDLETGKIIVDKGHLRSLKDGAASGSGEADIWQDIVEETVGKKKKSSTRHKKGTPNVKETGKVVVLGGIIYDITNCEQCADSERDELDPSPCPHKVSVSEKDSVAPSRLPNELKSRLAMTASLKEMIDVDIKASQSKKTQRTIRYQQGKDGVSKGSESLDIASTSRIEIPSGSFNEDDLEDELCTPFASEFMLQDPNVVRSTGLTPLIPGISLNSSKRDQQPFKPSFTPRSHEQNFDHSSPIVNHTKKHNKSPFTPTLAESLEMPYSTSPPARSASPPTRRNLWAPLDDDPLADKRWHTHHPDGSPPRMLSGFPFGSSPPIAWNASSKLSTDISDIDEPELMGSGDKENVVEIKKKARKAKKAKKAQGEKKAAVSDGTGYVKKAAVDEEEFDWKLLDETTVIPKNNFVIRGPDITISKKLRTGTPKKPKENKVVERKSGANKPNKQDLKASAPKISKSISEPILQLSTGRSKKVLELPLASCESHEMPPPETSVLSTPELAVNPSAETTAEPLSKTPAKPCGMPITSTPSEPCTASKVDDVKSPTSKASSPPLPTPPASFTSASSVVSDSRSSSAKLPSTPSTSSVIDRNDKPKASPTSAPTNFSATPVSRSTTTASTVFATPLPSSKTKLGTPRSSGTSKLKRKRPSVCPTPSKLGKQDMDDGVGFLDYLESRTVDVIGVTPNIKKEPHSGFGDEGAGDEGGKKPKVEKLDITTYGGIGEQSKTEMRAEVKKKAKDRRVSLFCLSDDSDDEATTTSRTKRDVVKATMAPLDRIGDIHASVPTVALNNNSLADLTDLTTLSTLDTDNEVEPYTSELETEPTDTTPVLGLGIGSPMAISMSMGISMGMHSPIGSMGSSGSLSGMSFNSAGIGRCGADGYVCSQPFCLACLSLYMGAPGDGEEA